MNTKSQQQIAREAALELYGTSHGTGQLDRLIAIILSAIERAKPEIIADFLMDMHTNGGKTSQPQRSEQQDDSPHWTQANEGESETSAQDECIEAIVKWVIADTKAVFPTITAYDDTCLRKEVSFQVNAALTAEREKIENLYKILGKKRVEIKQLKQDCLDSDKIIAQFSDQLTTERERRKQLEGNYEKIVTEVLKCNPIAAKDRADNQLEPPREVITRIRQQLLSTLAAIEKHNEMWKNPRLSTAQARRRSA